MNTTKELRAKMRYARHFLESPACEEMEKLLDDLDTLEAKLKERDELLWRAKELAERDEWPLPESKMWLFDYEKLKASE